MANKVAWWTAKFTEQIFRKDSPEAETARQWGYIAGLWHDIGKFAPTWQNYLRSKAAQRVNMSDTYCL
jgi:hypothetical protein